MISLTIDPADTVVSAKTTTLGSFALGLSNRLLIDDGPIERIATVDTPY